MECSVSNPSALLGLCSTLHGLSGTELQKKVNKYLTEWTEAETVFIVPIEHQERDSLFIQAAGLFQNQIKEGTIMSKNDLSDDNLKEFKALLGYDIRSFLSVPIPNPAEVTAKIKRRRTSSFFKEDLSSLQNSATNGVEHEQEAKMKTPDTAVLVCLVNKKNGEQFKEKDVKIVRECFQACIGILLTVFTLEEELSLKSQLQKLLTVAKNLFSHLGDVTVLLRQIMAEARRLTQAERCSLFLVDKKHNELVAKVFDGNILPDGTTEQQSEVRLPLNTGIVGHVAGTGMLINIKDAYHHPLFFRGCDEETGFKTRNILCFPICDSNEVIGVAELCNKQPGTHFTKFDEEMAMAFSSYCGLAILHSLMYKKVADAQYRSKLSNELMMYHMKVPEDEVTRLVSNSLESTKKTFPEFNLFKFTPRMIPLNDSTSAMFSIFSDLGMLQKWRIPRDSLARFILMVRRGYRDPPYHNWSHGFTVAHFSYLMLENCKLLAKGFISDLEAFALIIACMCHDLDHRGTNNTFQISSNSVLAALYSSEGSVMERHHFAQSMCILNTEGCNILENLNKKEYTQCLDMIRDNILATDLAHHLRMLPEMEAMVGGEMNPSNPKHHYLTSCLIMTASDLSDQTKDWINSKQIAELVYDEFFTQGDLEKAMGNKPVESMDREKAFIPTLQIQFLDHIVIPVYRVLADLDVQTEELYHSVLKNKEYWKVMGDILEERGVRSMDVMNVFQDDSLQNEVLEFCLKRKV